MKLFQREIVDKVKANEEVLQDDHKMAEILRQKGLCMTLEGKKYICKESYRSGSSGFFLDSGEKSGWSPANRSSFDEDRLLYVMEDGRAGMSFG